MDYRILLRFFPSRFVWLQVERGGRVFESKPQKEHLKKKGGVIRGLESLKMGLEGL